MRYRYTKFVGNLLEGLDLEDLVSRLSDLLLSSGFENPDDWGDPHGEDRSIQALKEAILDALMSGELLSQDTIDRLLGDPADTDAKSQLEELLDQIIGTD